MCSLLSLKFRSETFQALDATWTDDASLIGAPAAAELPAALHAAGTAVGHFCPTLIRVI